MQHEDKHELLYKKSYAEINNSEHEVVHVEQEHLDASVSISGIVRNRIFLSPNYGTFSNINLRFSNIDNAKFVLDKLLSFLRKKYHDTIITFPSEIYDPRINMMICHFLFKGMEITKIELNNHIPLTNIPRFNKSNRKRLRKLSDDFFTFHRAGLEEIDLVYHVLQENREHRGLSLSMSLNKMRNLLHVYNNDFKIWLIRERNDISVAAAITIDLTQNTRYVFYWGELPNYRKYSPVVLLADGLANETIACGKTILDLGTSSLDGNIDAGLIKFKSALGAVNTLKLTMSDKNAEL